VLRTMKPLFCISTLTLAACGVAGGTGPVPTTESGRVLDSTIASQSLRLDGAYDVTCTDGGQEVDSAEQIAGGLACVAARTATAHFLHMFMTESHVSWGASGPLNTGVDVTLKVMGTNVSAVFFDRSGNFPRPLTAGTVALAADGSLTATMTRVVVSTGCSRSFTRTTDSFTVSGVIDAYGAVALDDCSFYHENAVSNRIPFTCSPDGQWISLDRYWYDAQTPAEPTTLSD
jgi:hypothetical protein